jgi:hypothetical protein
LACSELNSKAGGRTEQHSVTERAAQNFDAAPAINEFNTKYCYDTEYLYLTLFG